MIDGISFGFGIALGMVVSTLCLMAFVAWMDSR